MQKFSDNIIKTILLGHEVNINISSKKNRFYSLEIKLVLTCALSIR